MAVFLGHTHGLIEPANFPLAVDFFFVLSGFVLTHAYWQKTNRPFFFRNFVIDRIARLYPVHFAVIVLLVFMNFWFTDITGTVLENNWSYQDGRAYTLLLNLLFLNNVGLTSHLSWNAPSWSLSVEIWVNFLLVIALVPISRKKFAVAVALMISVAAYLARQIMAQDDILQFGGMLRGLEGIAIGCVAYAAFYMIKDKPFPTLAIIIVSAVAIFCDAELLFRHLKRPHLRDLIVSASVLTVIALSLFELRVIRRDGYVGRVCEWFGDCSYSLYMWHWPVLIFANYFLAYAWKFPVDFKSPVQFAAIIVSVLTISRISYVHIEMPSKKAIRDRFLEGQFKLIGQADSPLSAPSTALHKNETASIAAVQSSAQA